MAIRLNLMKRYASQIPTLVVAHTFLVDPQHYPISTAPSHCRPNFIMTRSHTLFSILYHFRI